MSAKNLEEIVKKIKSSKELTIDQRIEFTELLFLAQDDVDNAFETLNTVPDAGDNTSAIEEKVEEIDDRVKVLEKPVVVKTNNGNNK